MAPRKRSKDENDGALGWIAGIVVVVLIAGILIAGWNSNPPPKIKGGIAEPQIALREGNCTRIQGVGCYGGPGK